MPSIKVLPEKVANMIAAGEVVERPASVVKELVENALDAESDSIQIHIARYGQGEITITDNGHGMGYHDAILAFERHATSKIQEADDLFHLQTLGFRGEALPSIASVSHLVLTTRARGAEIGTQVTLEGGKLLHVAEVGAPLGTTVRVCSLFKNIPARLKFIKTNAVELNHILSTFYQVALSHWTCSFTLSHNQKIIWHLPKAASLHQRILQLFGTELEHSLLEIDQTTEFFRVCGFLGSVTAVTTNRYSQYLFVNQRPVRNPLLLKAIGEGYRRILPQGRYPYTFLIFTIPPEQIDVNVHPAKIEVRFAHQQEIFDCLATLVKDRLNRSQPVPSLHSLSNSTLSGSHSRGEQQLESPSNPCPAGEEGLLYQKPPPESQNSWPQGVAFENGQVDFNPHQERQKRQAWQDSQGSQERQGSQAWQERDERQERHQSQQGHDERESLLKKVQIPLFSTAAQPTPLKDGDPVEFFSPLGDLLQLANTFIFYEIKKGLIVIDQHAAHERIRYEQLKQEHQSKHQIPSQELLHSLPFQVPKHLLDFAEELLTPLRSLGFELDHFGDTTFLIRAIPLFFENMNPQDIINTLFNNLFELAGSDTKNMTETILMRLACSSAIKANQRLTQAEMRALLEQLKQVAMPFRCPHGRPTTLHLPLHLFQKHFLRL